MTVRTTKKVVTFLKPFTLDSLDEVLEPGRYEVETDEELLDGLSFLAYRRLVTLIHLPTQLDKPGLTRTLSINPNELDAAVTRDAFLVLVGAGTDPSPGEPAHIATTGQDLDDQAADRADDEGMIVQRRQY